MMQKPVVTLPPTKHKRPDDFALDLILDGGNLDVKALVSPHSVAYLTDSEYAMLEADYRGSSGIQTGTCLFKWNGDSYLVGNDAELHGGVRELGARKYGVHYSALLISALLQLYPKSHDNVRIVATHPTGASADQRKELAQAIKRSFTVHLPGKITITYNVKQVVLIPEGRAAVQNFALTQTGKLYDRVQANYVGKRGLAFDGGGWISSVTLFSIATNGRVDINSAGSKPLPQIGIAPIFETLSASLRRLFPQQLGSLEIIPSSILQDALLTDAVTLHNHLYTTSPHNPELTVAKAVENAVKPTMNTIKAFIGANYQGAANIDFIIITGGGGGLLVRFLKTMVFNQFDEADIYLASRKVDDEKKPDPTQSRFDAVRGASKGYYSFLAAVG